MNVAGADWQGRYVAARDQLRNQHAALVALVGRRLAAGWTGHDPANGRWFQGLPVVLEFDDDRQVEIAWQKWDALSIAWNTVDLAGTPWVIGRPFAWRPGAPDAVAAVTGRVLTGLAVVETPYFHGDVDLSGELPLDAVAGWMESGLLLRFGDAQLHVFNHLDNTGISDGPGTDVRRVRDLRAP